MKVQSISESEKYNLQVEEVQFHMSDWLMAWLVRLEW